MIHENRLLLILLEALIWKNDVIKTSVIVSVNTNYILDLSIYQI